jgi:hypothetical protein
MRLGWRKAFGRVRRRITSMTRTLACVAVAVVLIAGCGGGSDSGGGNGGGSDSSSGPSAGDAQYVDPFRNSAGGGACLSKREIQQKIDRIAWPVENSERRQRAIQAVRARAC